MRKKSQFEMFRRQQLAYGGELLKTRKGRAGGRPLDTKSTMHLVLRSTKAVGVWSFREPGNARNVEKLTRKFCERNGIRLLSLANVGNHLHFHVKLSTRHTYRRFIRALTAAIAMSITGASRWKKGAGKFWDRRPFSRVVRGLRSFLTLKDYIAVNTLEGIGASREEAREIIAWKKSGAG